VTASSPQVRMVQAISRLRIRPNPPLESRCLGQRSCTANRGDPM